MLRISHFSRDWIEIFHDIFRIISSQRTDLVLAELRNQDLGRITNMSETSFQLWEPLFSFFLNMPRNCIHCLGSLASWIDTKQTLLIELIWSSDNSLISIRIVSWMQTVLLEMGNGFNANSIGANRIRLSFGIVIGYLNFYFKSVYSMPNWNVNVEHKVLYASIDSLLGLII